MSTAAIITGVEAKLAEVRSALAREITDKGDVCVTCSFQAEDMLLTRLALDLDPNSGKADFVLGVVASEKNDPKTALDYMNKAKASPAYQSDASLAKQINDALTKLNGANKPQL